VTRNETQSLWRIDMHTFLITLRGSERTQPALDHLASIGLEPIVVYGVRGTELDRRLIHSICAQTFVYRTLGPGEIGCYLSHHLIFRTIAKSNIERAFIFEDDARFANNPTALLRLLAESEVWPSNFNLNLCCKNTPENGMVKKTHAFNIGSVTIQQVARPMRLSTGYLVSNEYAKERLNSVFPIVRPFDMFGYLRLSSHCFVMMPEIVESAPLESQITLGRSDRLIGRVLRPGTRLRMSIDTVADRITNTWLERNLWPLDRTLETLAQVEACAC
jgi:GR25 family glycosyltransferase involved in LPS biosynthesis